MHLTLIISSLNPGGAERVLSELANHWIGQGHQISLVTLEALESKPFYPLDPKINLIQINQNQGQASLFVRLYTICKRIFCLRKTIQTLRPDVLVSFVDVMNITTLIARMGLNIPVIVSERIDPNFHRIPGLYRWLRLRFYPFASKIIVQTKNSENYFPLNLKQLIQIIPNPVPCPKAQKEFDDDVRRIITVGRLDVQKDHATLIHAFSHLFNDYPNLTLTIYGEGCERTNLEKLIVCLGLQDKVYLPGLTRDIRGALLKADLFIFPSCYEGFPNALCEAMAIGLPIIASACSGNVDVVRDGIDGRLFPIGDIPALVKITLQLLGDDKERRRLAKNAKEICIRFQAEKVFSLWDQLIAEITRERHAA